MSDAKSKSNEPQVMQMLRAKVEKQQAVAAEWGVTADSVKSGLTLKDAMWILRSMEEQEQYANDGWYWVGVACEAGGWETVFDIPKEKANG